MKVLQEVVNITKSEDEEGPPGSSCVQRAHQTLHAREDKQYGGFGSAPKFPQPGMCLCVSMHFTASELHTHKVLSILCFL